MYFALAEAWFGNPTAVHHCRSPGNTAWWARVPREEWEDLTNEGFRTCVSWSAAPETQGD